MRVLTNSILLKAVIAVSGFVWLGFLVAHVGTNLHIFGGPESLNDYYASLKANPVLLWGVRVLLLASIAAHAVAAYTLARRNSAARPVRYRRLRPLTTRYMVPPMHYSGPLIGIFIVYHLLHLTTGHAMPHQIDFREGDDYGNVVRSFSEAGYVAFIYILALLVLAFHLWHGVWSATLSLGTRHPHWDRRIRVGLRSIVLLVIVAFLAIPVAVLIGRLD